jgi:hypothetical protein
MDSWFDCVFAKIAKGFNSRVIIAKQFWLISWNAIEGFKSMVGWNGCFPVNNGCHRFM